MRGRVRGSWTAVGAGGWSMHEVSFVDLCLVSLKKGALEGT